MVTDIPDLSGKRLEQALKYLKDRGVENINIIHTAAPRLRDRWYGDNARILRLDVLKDGVVELLVSNMDFKDELKVKK